jgi:hypothetical protein
MGYEAGATRDARVRLGAIMLLATWLLLLIEIPAVIEAKVAKLYEIV